MNEVVYNFTKKNFVVTGASSGMGKEIVEELIKAGSMVLAIARRKDVLEKIESVHHDKVEIAACDVCRKDDLCNAIKNFVHTHGKLHGSVHAAGINDITPLKIFDEAIAKEIMNTSFWAGINFLQIVTKKDYSFSNSSHVMFSSVSAYTGEKGMFAYSCAKAAVQVAVKSLAKEIAKKGHRINSISPGWIKTSMTERLEDLINTEQLSDQHLLGTGTVEDISGLVLFLLSNRSRWITGTDIVVDGGYLAKR